MSGFIRCADCGSHYIGGGGPRPKKAGIDRDRYRFYKEAHPCGDLTGTLTKRIVEPLIIEAIGSILRQPPVFRLIEAEFDRLIESTAEDSVTPGLRRERARLEHERRNLVRAIATGTLTDAEARPELAELRARIEAIDVAIKRSQVTRHRHEALAGDRESMVALARDFATVAHRIHGAELRELVRPWIAEAIFDKRERVLTLCVRKIPNVGMFSVLELSGRPGRD